MTRDEIERAWRKIKLNSELPLVGNTELRFFDPAMVEKITETGRKNVRELVENLPAEIRPRL